MTEGRVNALLDVVRRRKGNGKEGSGEVLL
jgi:hypothetical protein